jgi:putative transcriptional regulator
MEIKKTDFQIEIINKVKEYRINQNVSQAYISEILGLNSNGLIGNIESPKYSHKYTLKQLHILSQKLNFSLEGLFFTEQELNEDKHTIIDNLIKKIIEYDG